VSYAALSAFADVDAWDHVWAHALGTSDVFVLRLRVSGVTLRDPTDALLFARAAGQGQNLALDVRAVAVSKTPDMGTDEAMIDVILTTTSLRAAVLWADDADAMAKKVAADASLRGAFPKLMITTAIFGQLTAPPEAIDLWRSQPMLWDHNLPGPKNLGGPTDAMSAPADYNVVTGKADDGARAVPWKIGKPPLGPDKKPPATDPMMIGGAVVALAAVALLARQPKERRRHV
jgi:hypothetical protein